MKHKKLIRLLDALSKDKSVADFKRYLKSPATQSARLVALLDYLDKANRNEEVLSEAMVFKKVISANNAYDEKKVRNLFSALTGLLEDFIEIKRLRKKSSLRKRLLAEFLQERQLDSQFLKTARDGISKNLPEREVERHTELWLGNRLLYFHPKANLHEEAEFDEALEDWHFNLNVLHAIDSLKYCCEAVVLNKTYGKILSADFQAYFTAYIQLLSAETKKVALVNAYVLAAEFYLKPSLKRYHAFKAYLLPLLDTFRSERGSLLIYLINALNIVNFPNDRVAEYFGLLKLGVERGLFSEKGVISSSYFNNIVYISCEMREFEWAENFVGTHISLLRNKADSLVNIKLLLQCFFDFGKGKHQEVLGNLDRIHYEDYTYAVWKYSLELKCIYEMQGANGCGEIVERSRYFKELITRKYKAKGKKRGISLGQKVRIENFIKLLTTLACGPFKKVTKAELRAMHDACAGKIIEQRWVRQKIEAY